MGKQIHIISHQDPNEFNEQFIEFVAKNPEAEYTFFASAVGIAQASAPVKIPGLELPQQKMDVQVIQIYNVAFTWEGEIEEEKAVEQYKEDIGI